MIIYNKSQQKSVNLNTPTSTVKATRPKLTEENKKFLKLLNLKVKKNV